METSRGVPKNLGGLPASDDIYMKTAKGFNTIANDIRMETARGGTTMKQSPHQLWERELIESAEVKRKATVAQLC